VDIQHLWQSFLAWMHSPDSVIIALFGLIWMFVFVKSLLVPSLKRSKDAIKTSEATIRAIEAMIDQAVKRAPPIEAKPSEEAAPFEEYRKDLWRMAEGEISIDEFVDIWRGRKVQKRPPKEKKLTPEEIKEVTNSEIFKTIATVISEFSKGLEKIVEWKKLEALRPTAYNVPIRRHDSSSIIGADGFQGVHGPIGISGIEYLKAPKSPKHHVGNYIRVNRPTSPAFGQIARIESITDNSMDLVYCVKVHDIRGQQPFFLGLSDEDFGIARPRAGEWWRWKENVHCYRSTSYEPFVWKGLDDDAQFDLCCRAGCLLPVNLGRGE